MSQRHAERSRICDKADGSKLAKKRRRNFDGLGGGGGRTEGEGAFRKGEIPSGKGDSKGGIRGRFESRAGHFGTNKTGGGKKAGRT